MRFGFGVLRLSARDFWALTPHELNAASQAYGGDAATPFERGTFEALAAAFPDERDMP